MDFHKQDDLWKKMRKRRALGYYGFRTFGDPGIHFQLKGAFRDNVRQFLQECARPELSPPEGMPTWRIVLIEENSEVSISLFVVVEQISRHSVRPYCDYCRCIGWSHHFVSKRRYHFIIPASDPDISPPEWARLDRTDSLLHGMIHCNGFGHLICVNGLENGSKHVSGVEIVDLWDRMCGLLRTREVSVEDVAKKRKMQLRLLHSVAYERPWFGRWGYVFGRGSFGVTAATYETAMKFLCGFPIAVVLNDFRSAGNAQMMKHIVHKYSTLSESNMVTMKDLLHFMLQLRSRLTFNLPSDSAETFKPILQVPAAPTKKIRSSTAGGVAVRPVLPKDLSFPTSRWSDKRLRYAADVVLHCLLEAGGQMSRQEVRDAARMHIGDTGLLDFVLKSLNDCIIGRHIIFRRVNPTTRVLEYTAVEGGSDNGIGGGCRRHNDLVDGRVVLELSDDGEEDNNSGSITENSGSARPEIGRAEVMKDIVYVYKNVLESYWPAKLRKTPEAAMMQAAVKVVLDTKLFVKSWPFSDDADTMLRFLCTMVPGCTAEAEELTRMTPPPEVVVVPLHATVGDLKRGVEMALQDTYCIAEEFVVRKMDGLLMDELEEEEDDQPLFGVAQSGDRVWVHGSGLHLVDGGLVYEGGVDNWVVRCSCGARDDDGEKMIACDICEVWQHTRCGGIADGETPPPIFICDACAGSLMPMSLTPWMSE